MSFFDTEEAHAVVLAKVHPVEFRLRRTPLRGVPQGEDKGPDISGPGSSVKSRLRAAAQFGAKKDIHILGDTLLTELNA